MDLEKLIEIAQTMVKPYKYTAYLLSFLLICSIACNIYLATREMEVILQADNNTLSETSVIEQNKG